jgi:hypothetical protein
LLISASTGISFWRLHGEVVALLTFLGLHAINDDSNYLPTASSEAKRRTFTKIFIIDKVVASFTGRPPLISRRYVTTPLPLDISDEVLLGDETTRARAVDALDEKGWGKEGHLYSTTIIRARSILAYNRDEIFEIALGHSGETSVEDLL